MQQPKYLSVVSWMVLLVVTLIGLGAAVVRITEGLGVTNLNYIVPWGLWVAFYIYFIGLSAGSFLLSSMIYVFGFKKLEPVGRLALFSALIALITGMNFVLLDLGHMERFWTVFINRNMWSVLEIEIHFYIVYIVILVSELWLLMRRDLIRCSEGDTWQARICRWLTLGSRDVSDEAAARDMRLVKILGVIGLPVAIGVHGGTGALFAVIKARPMWFGPLFPIIFIVSALVSGAALLTFILAFFAGKNMDRSQHRDLVLMLGKITAGLLAVDLLLIWSEFSVGIYSSIPEDQEVLRLILFGPFWWVFWFVQIVFGALVPMLLILLPATRRNPRWVGLACFMVVVGIVGVRLNIVIPPLSTPVLPGFDAAYTVLAAPDQNAPAYPASLLSWLDRLAVAAAAMTFLIFGYVIWRRLGNRNARTQRVTIGVGTTFAVLSLVFFSHSLLGGTTLFDLGAGNFDLANTPISGILGHTELRSYYIPSPNEWLSSAGVIGLALVLFGLGHQILPLETTEEH